MMVARVPQLQFGNPPKCSPHGAECGAFVAPFSRITLRFIRATLAGLVYNGECGAREPSRIQLLTTLNMCVKYIKIHR